MYRDSLKQHIEKLNPLDSEAKINELVSLMEERNTNIDCYLDKWICSLICSAPLVAYFKDRSSQLKHHKASSETMDFLCDLLVKYYPVDNENKVNEIFQELKKNDHLLSLSDFNFANGKMVNKKSKERWEKLYKDETEIIIRFESILHQKVVSVPQPLATLLIVGAVKEIQFENYYKLHEGDTVYVYASVFSSDIMYKIKYNFNIWSHFSNGIFTGSINEEIFPENCYIGKFEIGYKFPNGVEQIRKPEIFTKPIEADVRLFPANPLLSSYPFKMKHVHLLDRTIIVPVNDEIWDQVERQEGDAFFYWEERYDKIIHIKSLEELLDDNIDDEDEEEILEDVAGDKQGLFDILFINGDKQKRVRQKNKNAVRCESYRTKAGTCFTALVFDFENIVAIEERQSSFSVLQKKEWILDWNCVRFKNGMIIVSSPADGSVKFKAKAFQLQGALESYNYLKEYLQDRLAPIHCSVEKMELAIFDTIRLNEAIQKFATASKQRGISVSKNKSSNGVVVPRQISFTQALSKAKQMTPEEFEKYKSEYIDYLVKQQSKKYKVIPCVERLAHRDSDITEYAFMFSIKCKSGDILIVHENVNPDRSTLLFVVKQENYDRAIREIYDFLQSAEINKRSSLRDRNIEIKKAGVEFYSSINHDYFFSWSRMIKNYKEYYENGHVFMVY